MNASSKKDLRIRRHARIRARVHGNATRPRLSVFKSNRYLSVQLINDETGTTLAAMHGKEVSGALAKQASELGAGIAKKAQELHISEVVFDRGGYRYAGQIRSLAEAARAAGLTF